VERVSWRLEVRHITRYRYDRPVIASYNEARVTPSATADQNVVTSKVSVEPAAELFTYRDYWGTVVHAFDVHTPHQSLVVTARSTVETGRASSLPDGEAAPGRGPALEAASWGDISSFGDISSWGDLAAGDVTDRFYELLAPSPLVDPTDLGTVATGLRAGCSTPAEAAEAAVRWAHGQLEYGSGTTSVRTSAAEAWRAGRGVCQDFAHLSLAVLRAMGIPSRYISGYFYPEGEATVGSRVVGESHAWVEAWTGHWSGHDPTNLVGTGERHVVVARGRDYTDVAPMRGIFSGPPGSSTEVTVELTRRA
jgi:transglutaminase-like putative cysteine protease